MPDLDDLLTPPSTEHNPSIDWSPLQQDIFEEVVSGTGNVIIEAVAGSAKTTTMIEAMKVDIPPGKSVLAMAFNKAIATELQMKVPSTVDASTFHSLGLRIIREHSPKVKVKAPKIHWLCKDHLRDEIEKDYGYLIQRSISWFKNGFKQNIEDMEDFYLETDELTDDDPDALTMAKYAWDILCRCELDTATVDFDDMLYLPVLNELQFPSYDYIFVDEAQDLNVIQQFFMQRLVEASPNVRLFFFGDSAQAIYGFRGADHKSMDTLKNLFDCKKMTLSITYRCPKAVTEVAKKYVAEITAADWAEEGSVETIPLLQDLDCFNAGDMVVCRNNAPLFSLGLKFLKARKPVYFMSNAAQGIKSFIKKICTNTRTEPIEEFIVDLHKWKEKEIDKAEENEQWSKCDAIMDKFEAINVMATSLIDEQSPGSDLSADPRSIMATTGDLLNLLDELFNEKTGTILSTVHKAKGLEADTIYFLEPQRCPSKWAKSDNALKQEYNIIYVAVTRAKQKLVYLDTDKEI